MTSKNPRPFQIGDVVYLNSGSPDLVVDSFFRREEVLSVGVSWFNDEGEPQTHAFPVACLTRVPNETT